MTAWSYWPTLADVFHAWMHQPDYSHGFLVAPLAAAFLWLRRQQLPWGQLEPSTAGLLLLLALGMIRIQAARYYLEPIDAWTIPLWLAACTWMMFGWKCLMWARSSILFLWFMLPMPYSMERWFSTPLQSIATRLSTVALVFLGQPAIAEGNTIWIGEHRLFVEEACSGLRIFVGILALAFAFVLFSNREWWQKLLAVAAVFPVALLANSLRIVAIGLVSEFSSSDEIRTLAHDLSGLLIIPVAGGMFWLFLTYLDRLFPETELIKPDIEVHS
jgi:exosortase